MQFSDARKYKKQIKKLYRSAFPANERAPLFVLFKRTDNGRDSFRAVEDEGRFVGLVYTISAEKFVYVFFLAVEENERGKGYGTRILAQLKEMHGDKAVCLMIEDPEEPDAKNADERISRLKFYQRNGFERLYIKINEAGVNYELLGTDSSVTQADFLKMMKGYLGAFLFKIIYRKMRAS